MPNPTPTTVAAAARAAAKRAERARRTDAEESAAPEAKEAEAGHVLPVDDAPDDTAEGAGAGGRRRAVISAVLALLVVAGLVAAAGLGWEYRDGRQTAAARVEAVAAARKAVPLVLSYDYRRLDRDFAAARGHLTGAFREEYKKTTTTVVAPTAEKYQGVVKATIAAPQGGGAPAVSVVSASPDKVVVLLFVNQVTKSTQVSGSRLDMNRVRMTLTRTSDGWKVSNVDAL